MQYTFRAIKDNIIVSKKITADSEKAVVKYLRENGYFPVEIKAQGGSGISIFDEFFDKISFNDVVDFTRQIAIMLNAGLTLVDSFSILKKQVAKPAIQKLLTDIDSEIKSGNTFSYALKKYPQYFPNLYIALIKSGEASGKLGEILLKLAENLEKEREFKGKLKGALTYPALVVVAMIIVMFIMVTFVIPKLLGLYKDFKVELPLSTQILIAVSNFCTQFWPAIILGSFFGFIFLQRYFKTPVGRLMVDKLMFKMPVVSNVIKISALVNATRTLSILIGSGVSILEALSIIIDTTDNVIYQKAFKNILKQVEKGQSLGSALDQEGIFPPILVQMALVGEQTGHLDDTLMRLSKYFEMESELAIKAVTTLIEPAILVFLGVGVGFLVMSVITPIYNLTSSFK